MEPVATETVTVFAQNFALAEARENVADCARTFELEIVAIEEDRQRLRTEMRVTVTGAASMIEGFREVLGGDAWEAPSGDLFDMPITAFLSWATRAVQRRRRAGRRPHDDAGNAR